MSERTKAVYVGSGDWSGETGKIQVFTLDLETLRLSLRQELGGFGAAAFMARSPDARTLYVIDETKSHIFSYAVTPGSGELTLKNQVVPAGHPVYVALDRTGAALTTCFFGEGKTQVFAIRPDGSLGASTALVDSGRESHCTVFDASQRFLFVPTRGDNWIAQYHFDLSTLGLQPQTPARVQATEGAGPRHLGFHPNGRFAYLVNELSLTLTAYRFDEGRGGLEPLQSDVATAPAGVSGGSGADVHVHPSGRFLYVSNRQEDQSTLAIFAVDPSSGRVTLVGHESTRGRTPRNFGLDAEGQILIVGNQGSRDVALFRINDGGGALRYVGSQSVAAGPFFVGIY
jgi:6-phosphogluconolactonase